MLAREILERSEHEYGLRGTPSWDKLSAAIDATTLTIPLTGRVTYTPKESTLEFMDDSMECALVDTVSTTTATAQERGYLETAPAAHAAGTRVAIDPRYKRIQIFNALRSLIGQLYSFGLYRRNLDSKTFTTTEPVVLDAADREVISPVWFKTGNRWQQLKKGEHFEVIHVSPIEIQFWGYAQQGAQLRIATKRDFSLPAALTDDLDALGIPSGLQPYLPMGIAGSLLIAKETPEVDTETIKRALAAGVPVGGHLNVGRALLQQFLVHVAAERTRQLEQAPSQVISGGVS